MPQSTPARVPRRCRPRRRRRSGLAVAALALAMPALLGGCGGNSDRPLPDARPPAVDTLTAAQIVTEAQRALAAASSVHITGAYRENNVPVTLDMRIAAGNKASGTVTTNGTKVELRRIGDQLYVKGDDAFLAALGEKARATKGKWLVGPVATADRGLADLTDLRRFAGTLTPGKGALRKEAVRSLAGRPAVTVLNPAGARLWVADANPPYPVRLERLGTATGILDYKEYGVRVDVTAPSPTVPLSSVTS